MVLVLDMMVQNQILQSAELRRTNNPNFVNMDIQFILMIALFVAALFYVGRVIYRSVAPKKGSCATGCGKCGADFSKIPDTNTK